LPQQQQKTRAKQQVLYGNGIASKTKNLHKQQVL
jgi:hypothetical protein